MSILIITHSRDATIDYLEREYNDELSIYRLNVDQLHLYDINVKNSGTIGTTIVGPAKTISSDNISSVYYRKTVLPDLQEYNSSFHSLMHRDILSLVEGIAETCGNYCLTRPSILKRAENKVVQLLLANEIGFSTPPALITNSSSEASSFIEVNKSIVKPLSTGRVVNKQLDGIIQTNLVYKNKQLQELCLSPAYFQKYARKTGGEFRVTIVGQEVFPVHIVSSNPIDWRVSGSINKYTVRDFPQPLLKKCFKMMKSLQIDFGAFDFIKSGDDFYFLEVNPNGQWLWLEVNLGISISSSIIQLLKKGEK